MGINRRFIATPLLSLAAVGLTAGTAFASSPTPGNTTAVGSQTVAAIQKAGDAAISARLTALATAQSKVGANSNLGPDAAALAVTMQDDVNGLTQLESTLNAATTIPAARAAAAQITAGFRIYALVLPVTSLVSATDRLNNSVAPKLTDFATKAASRVTASDAGTIDPLLANLNAEVGTATSDLSGLNTTLLGYTPSSWNANHALLAPATASVKAARAALGTARSDAATVLADLKAARNTGGVPTTSTIPAP
jgi:hypothetical protein